MHLNHCISSLYSNPRVENTIILEWSVTKILPTPLFWLNHTGEHVPCMRSQRAGKLLKALSVEQGSLWESIWYMIIGSLEGQKVSRNRTQVLLKEIEAHSREVPGWCWSKMWRQTAWVWETVASSAHHISRITGPTTDTWLSKHILGDYSSVINYRLNWLPAFWFIQQIFIEYLLQHHH